MFNRYVFTQIMDYLGDCQRYVQEQVYVQRNSIPSNCLLGNRCLLISPYLPPSSANQKPFFNIIPASHPSQDSIQKRIEVIFVRSIVVCHAIIVMVMVRRLFLLLPSPRRRRRALLPPRRSVWCNLALALPSVNPALEAADSAPESFQFDCVFHNI
jgi:hypothetical protein